MHRFDRDIIENNAMSENVLELPESLIVSQIITLIDCSTFESYYQNMRVKMADIIRPANLILFNRIDGFEEKLLSYKRSLMLLNNEADYVFQNTNGDVIDTLADELPYDINSDVIEIKDSDYGTFFIDSYDQKERYNGKIVKLNAVCYTQEDGSIVVGRLAMTCCENDIQLLGFITDLKDKFKANEWISLKAKIKYENIENDEEPVLGIIEYERIKQIKDPVVTL